MEIYALPSGTTPSAPNFRTRAVLVRVSLSPLKYERRTPDGSVETFAQLDGELGFPRKIFMTESADPQGNKLSYLFNDSLQIEAIVDAMGQVSLLSYGDGSSPQRITAITDPFGRTARITYDASGRIDSITDTLGLTSSFNYGPSDFITSMTTPYGTTIFSTGETFFRTWLEAEDPMGGRERIEYVLHHDASVGPRTLPSAEIPSGFNSFNNNWDAAATLFWDKRAMLLAPLQISSAEITHWLEQPATHKPRGIARGRKKALESRVWYVYEGQSTLRANVKKYPKVMYYTTAWRMTWIFFDDKDVVREYYLTAQ